MTTKNELKSFTYKMVVLGYYSVGKSSLVLKYVKGEFNPNEESTIGASFLTKTIFVNDYSIKFEIWDTAGQERYNSLIPMYYRGAQVALIVYDITSRESFDTAKRWVEELNFEKPSGFIKVLIGNKTDLERDRQVSTVEAKRYSETHNLFFIEASAKDDINVAKIFEIVANNVPKEKPKPNKKGLKLGESYMKYFCC
jgi:Ras-related protein Rab-5C